MTWMERRPAKCNSWSSPTGTYEIVLETFKIGSIAHSNVVLVSNADVTATADIDKAKQGYHTAVIWDTEMAHAIAAAPLN